MKSAIMLGVPSLLTYLIGIRWEFLIIWLVLVGFDLITGVISSRYNNSWKSSVMTKGLLGKCNETILILAVVLVQRFVQLSNIVTPPIFEILMVAFCYKEFGSIIENVKKTGKNIPDFLLKMFKITENKHYLRIDNNDFKKDGDNSEKD